MFKTWPCPNSPCGWKDTLSQFGNYHRIKLIGLWCNYYQYISYFMVFLSSLIFVYNILRLLGWKMWWNSADNGLKNLQNTCWAGAQSWKFKKGPCPNSGSSKKKPCAKAGSSKRHPVQRHIPSTPKYASAPPPPRIKSSSRHFQLWLADCKRFSSDEIYFQSFLVSSVSDIAGSLCDRVVSCSA